MRLSHCQLRRLNQAVLALHQEEAGLDILPRVMEHLDKLMPITWMSAEYLNTATGQLSHQAGRNAECIPNIHEGIAQFGYQNPIAQLCQERGFFPAMNMMQCVTFRQFTQTGLYGEVMHHMTGFRDQAVLMVPMPGQILGFTLNREREFTVEEVLMLELLQPHLAAVLARATQYASLPAQPPLSPREREVLHWLAEGKIAVILRISQRTVSQHVRFLLQKLGVESRTAAAAVAWRARMGVEQIS